VLGPAPPSSAALGRALLACALSALALAAFAARAPGAAAVILPAQTIEGPGEEVVGFGGVAMAEDGTGGLVFLKRVDGVPHVFVSRYVEGKWLAPVRVDSCAPVSSSDAEGACNEPYEASWPRIGAAEHGELIVVWATPFATRDGRLLYELVGSLLGPGGQTFGPPMIIDRNIEEATGTSPDLAVSSTGQADVVYRVVEPNNTSVTPLRSGDVTEQVRLAVFDGERWTNVGAINRNLGVSMRPPSEANAPKVAIGPTGNGVVVWQEPEIEGVAEIWARRIFGTALDYVMPVSTSTFNGAPIPDDAEAPSVSFSRLGQAEVAYRQPAGPGSPLPGPRIFLNVLSDGESESGAEFKGALIADGEVPGGKAAFVGPPSIDIDEQRYMRMLYDDDGMPKVIDGTDRGLITAVSLGPPFAGPEPLAVSVMNPQGGGVSAWPSANAQGQPEVAAREDFPSGAVQTALLSGASGGEVTELSVGRSGLGDGLIAFRQGPLGDAAIVVATVTAPPVAALMTVPNGWVKPSQATISWLPAVSGAGPLTYEVVVDGHVQKPPPGALRFHIRTRGLGPGRHQVQVLASDRNGQSTLSAPSALLLDGVPPKVRIKRAEHGAGVTVRVSDAYSGLDAKAVRVSFGDGTSAHGRARLSHRYARAGVYRVVVRSRDELGNAGVVRQWVSVR